MPLRVVVLDLDMHINICKNRQSGTILYEHMKHVGIVTFLKVTLAFIPILTFR